MKKIEGGRFRSNLNRRCHLASSIYLTVPFVFNFVQFTLSCGSKTAIFAVNFRLLF